MLVVLDNKYQSHWTLGQPTGHLPYNGEVVLAIDPSKTNMAILIGTGEPLTLKDFYNEDWPKSIIHTLEFSGNGRGRESPPEDTTFYCEEIRQFLHSYLDGVKFRYVAVEQAITKKGASASHTTNMVLTEIRGNILNFFLDRFGVKVLEINNWAWKHAILPEGYRGRDQKGSKLYFVRNLPDSPFAHYFEADMTDCICMYLYVLMKFCSQRSIFCSTAEPKLNDYSYSFVPVSLDTSKHYIEFDYNPRFSLAENLNYYANRTNSNFVLVIDWSVPTLEDLYTKCTFTKWSCIDEDRVKVIVCRL